MEPFFILSTIAAGIGAVVAMLFPLVILARRTPGLRRIFGTALEPAKWLRVAGFVFGIAFPTALGLAFSALVKASLDFTDLPKPIIVVPLVIVPLTVAVVMFILFRVLNILHGKG